MIYFRSSFFYLGYIISAFFVGFFGCLIIPFFKLKSRLKLLSIWPRFSNWLLCVSCRIKVSVEGIDNIPEPPFVIVSNHQGQWETFYYQYFFFPLTTLLKKELLLIPFWGWALSYLSPIAIDRNNPKSALKKTLKEGEERIKKGFLILFFPEGTRNKPGTVGSYARSGFELARRVGVPVVPLVQNSGDCWPAHKFLKYPGKITLRIGRPLKDIASSHDASKEVEEWTRKNLLEISDLN